MGYQRCALRCLRDLQKTLAVDETAQLAHAHL